MDDNNENILAVNGFRKIETDSYCRTVRADSALFPNPRCVKGAHLVTFETTMITTSK